MRVGGIDKGRGEDVHDFSRTEGLGVSDTDVAVVMNYRLHGVPGTGLCSVAGGIDAREIPNYVEAWAQASGPAGSEPKVVFVIMSYCDTATSFNSQKKKNPPFRTILTIFARIMT